MLCYITKLLLQVFMGNLFDFWIDKCCYSRVQLKAVCNNNKLIIRRIYPP
jgi:hypothetical protein